MTNIIIILGDDMEKYELAALILKDADMSVYTLTGLLDDLKKKDNKIKGTVEDILKGYERYLDRAKTFLEEKECDEKFESRIAKMMSRMGVKKEVKSDNSDSAIAEMLIQGVSMGSLDMEKSLSEYEKDAEKEELEMAHDFYDFQQDVITALKKYL